MVGMNWTCKRGFGEAIDRVGVPKAVLSARRAASPWITILTYHRVARRDDPTIIDRGVVDASPEQLSRHLAFIKRWFRPIGINELAAFSVGRGKLPRNPIMVTFDAGYRDCHDVVLPELLKHGVRAVFFLATDYIERRKLYWWDRITLLVNQSRRARMGLTYPEPMALPLDGDEARRNAVKRLTRMVKDRPGLDLPRFLEEVERAAGASLSEEEERALADATMMTWDQAAALRRAGMDVQSHTHTHRALQTLPGRELELELRASREALEDVLGERAVGVAYPAGRALGDAPQIRQAVRDAGYRLGFSNATGVNRSWSLDALDVRRVSMDHSIGESFFRAMLAVPWLTA